MLQHASCCTALGIRRHAPSTAPTLSLEQLPIGVCTATMHKQAAARGVSHSVSRLVIAESELGTLPISELDSRSLHHPNTTEPHYMGLRRNPQQNCPSIPAHRAAPLDLLYPAIR